jgi:general secretion pathway protein J
MSMPRPSDRRRSGFTLIEVLVAVVIFALMSAAAYAAVDTLLRARENLHARAETLRQLQTTIGRLERDLRQAIDRGVREGYGDRAEMLRGDGVALELTRAGLANPLGATRSRLERVQWALADQQINRVSFAVLDRAIDSRPTITPMLDSVTRLEFRYLDGGQWSNQWPRANAREGIDAGLPRAIAVVIATREYGELRRVVELAGALPAAAGAASP